MKEKEQPKPKTTKQLVLEDFEENLKIARENGLNYFPTGLLKYYLFTGKFPTYAGRIIKAYCDEHKITIKRAGEFGAENWEDEHIHGRMSVFTWQDKQKRRK